jgi:hypothetical protein
MSAKVRECGSAKVKRYEGTKVRGYESTRVRRYGGMLLGVLAVLVFGVEAAEAQSLPGAPLALAHGVERGALPRSADRRGGALHRGVA